MFAVNQSLVKKIIYNDNRLGVCPYFIYKVYITKEVKTNRTLSMMKGSFLETLFIGAGINDEKIYDLPRKIPTKKMLQRNPNAVGEKRIYQIRLEKQAEKGKKVAAEKNITIEKFNTQIKIYKRWEKNPKVLLVGTIDIGPTIFVTAKKEPYVALVDVKYTANVTSTYGPFPWGDFSRMDKLQAQQYLYLIKDIDFELNDKLNPGNNLRELFSGRIENLIKQDKIRFYYWVFDDTPKMNMRFFPYDMDKLKWFAYHERMRKAVAFLEEMHSNGYPCNPKPELCSGCPVRDCPERNEIEYTEPTDLNL